MQECCHMNIARLCVHDDPMLTNSLCDQARSSVRMTPRFKCSIYLSILMTELKTKITVNTTLHELLFISFPVFLFLDFIHLLLLKMAGCAICHRLLPPSISWHRATVHAMRQNYNDACLHEDSRLRIHVWFWGNITKIWDPTWSQSVD